MVRSLELKQNHLATDLRKAFSLVLRTYDGIDVDRKTLLRLDADQALALHLGPEALAFSGTTPEGEGQPGSIEIRRLTNDISGTYGFEGFILGRSIGKISDGTVLELQELANPQFEDGQPDWELRDIERHEARIILERDYLDAQERALTDKKQAWCRKIAMSEDGPPPFVHDRMRNTALSEDLLPIGITVRMIAMFCKANDLDFFSTGTPEGGGWNRQDCFHCVSLSNHSLGVSKSWDELRLWLNPQMDPGADNDPEI